MKRKILSNKVAIITGASGGIGEAIVNMFSDEGAKVIIHYFKNKEKAVSLSRNIQTKKGEAIAISANVSDYDQVKAMIKKTIETFKKIDILVNNAGIIKDATLQNMSEETWDEVINVNLKGVFNCCKLVVPYMIRQKFGRIINISALAGEIGNFGQTNYAASKSAIFGFSKSLAKELARFNITVNIISPGLINTNMLKAIPKAVMEYFLQRIPLGRIGNPIDVAHSALFLSSDSAKYITGQLIGVNGGLH